MFGRKAKRPAALGSLRNEENVQIIHSMGNTHKNIGEEEEEEEEEEEGGGGGGGGKMKERNKKKRNKKGRRKTFQRWKR